MHQSKALETNMAKAAAERIPEARYAYYRRCQVFRKGGVQCKAPAEKGEQICHAHAAQQAMAVRRERERRAVLEEAVAQMRKRGEPDYEMADLFMDFKGINMTMAVMAKALIAGRIECKTAGRLLVQLQTVSKLLWMMKSKPLPLINTDNTDLQKANANLTTESRRHGEQPEAGKNGAANHLASNPGHEVRLALVAEVLAVVEKHGWSHAPPELLRAA